MCKVVQFAIEVRAVDLRVTRRRMAEEKLAIHVVFEHIAGCSRFIGLSLSCCCKSSRFRVSSEELGGRRRTRPSLLQWTYMYLDAIHRLKERLWDALGD